MRFTRKTTLCNWGFFAFILAILWGQYRIFNENLSQHYYLFTEAARLTWEGQNPYDMAISPVGAWFYSISSALFFFSGFNIFPLKAGETVFLSGSLIIFIASVRWLIKETLQAQYAPLVWILLIPQTLSGIYSVKIEILMTGLLIFCFMGLWKSPHHTKKRILYYFLLGMISNWKFLVIPSVGLLLTYEWFSQKKYSGVFLYLGSLLFWHYIPLTVMSYEHFSLLNETKNASVFSFLERSLYYFDSLYSFLKNTLSISIPWNISLLFSSFFGLLFFLQMMDFSRKNKKSFDQIIWALALGASFSVLFNPISQNNAMIQLTPLYFLVIYLYQENKEFFAPLWIRGITSISLIVITLGYSDLFQKWIRPLTLKPFFLFILVFILILRGRTLTKLERR
tara:strand:+ start:1863 stop:3047 length:1185 start_codon:yes stop_codon:yes gene_type:complete